MMRPGSIVFRVTLFATGLILLYGVYVAGQRAVAGVSAYLLQEHLDAWEEKESPPQPREWEKANALFELTLALTPGDPDLYQQGGRLFEWRAEMARADADARGRFLDRATDHFGASVRLRPTWPYGWTDLAYAKARSGRLDAEFQRAFERALTLGPWEETIQLDMVRLGLLTWDNLSRDNRERLLENVRNTARRQAGPLMDVAEAQGRMVLVCYAVIGNEWVDRICAEKGVKE